MTPDTPAQTKTGRNTGMWSPAFWKDAAERAIRTMAQVLASMLIASGTGLLDIDWPATLSTAGTATLLSLLTSIASETRTPNGTASLYTREPRPPSADDSIPTR
jgi:hypothetical protein